MRYLLLAALLSGCGGGGSSAPSGGIVQPGPQPTTAHTFQDYFPFLQGKSGTATAVARTSGAVLATYTFGPDFANWNGSIERWAIGTCNGVPWAVVLGYQQVSGPLWEAVSPKTLWDGIPVVCDKGAAYAPVNLTPGVHTIQQWGVIAGDHEYYWQSEFTFGGSEMNPCWTGQDPSRPVIVQREVWQDRGGATVRGTVIGDPWLVTPQVVYDWRVTAGLGVGTLWTASDHSGEWCLKSITIN